MKNSIYEGWVMLELFDTYLRNDTYCQTNRNGKIPDGFNPDVYPCRGIMD